MPLRLHVHAAEAVHAEGVLDAVDVLGGREQPDHVRAAEDQGLLVPPALRHAATLQAVPLSGRARSEGLSLGPGSSGRWPSRTKPCSQVVSRRSVRVRTGPGLRAERTVGPAVESGRGCNRQGAERSPDRARHRDARRSRVHALRRGDQALRVHGRLPRDARLLHRGAATSSASTSPRTRSARSSPATGRPARRSSGSARTATRTETAASTTGRWACVTALEVCRLNDRARARPARCSSSRSSRRRARASDRCCSASRIMLQRVTRGGAPRDVPRDDDGRSFWEHAAEAGYEPERWRESIHVLDDLTGWIEMHIEQARVLQDTGNRIGIVTAIAGYVHARRGRHRPRRPRGRDADGPPARPDAAARRDGPRAGAPGDGGGPGHRRHRGRDRDRPGPDQRRRGARALLARRARPVDDVYRSVATARRRRSRRRPPGAAA